MLYVIITLQRAFSFGLLRLLNQWLRLWLGLWFWLGLGSQLLNQWLRFWLGLGLGSQLG